MDLLSSIHLLKVMAGMIMTHNQQLEFPEYTLPGTLGLMAYSGADTYYELEDAEDSTSGIVWYI